MSHPMRVVAAAFVVPVLVLTVLSVFTGALIAVAAEPDPMQTRQQASKAYQDGNFQDAYNMYRSLVLAKEAGGEALASDLARGIQSLQRLQRENEADSFIAEAKDTHPEDFRLLWELGNQFQQLPPYGFIVAGEFQRGRQRGGGQYVQVTHRDRAESLMNFELARQAIPEDLSNKDKAQFFHDYANAVQRDRNGNMSWQLQDLTDLNELPDYVLTEYGNRRGGSDGAPVNSEGEPLVFDVPESFEAAKSDGERWRWCQEQIAESDPSRRNEVTFNYASWLRQQWGVQTLRRWGIRLPGYQDEEDGEADAGVWSLPTLGEDETITRLANGIQRFTMPEGHNFLAMYEQIVDSDSDSYADSALQQLAQIFEDRQQYPRAAEQWRTFIERFPSQKQFAQQRLDQIVGNWGQFEATMSQPAGQGATIDFRFRNAKSVSFEAQAIDVPELIADIQAYLKSNPAELDWQHLQIDNIGYRIVEQNQQKYVGQRVANWTLELDPREKHFDRRVTVSTPLQKAGAYLVTAKVANGNTSRIIVWLNDTAIVSKRLNSQQMYFIADATTGQPIERSKVEFFGWRQERVENTKRQYRVLTQNFAKFTDADGMVRTVARLQDPNYQWIAIARDGRAASDQGRFAFYGFTGVWFGSQSDPRYDQTKVYVITDRPVYRPDQTVKFKFWIREAKYDAEQGTRFANQEFTIKINDPQGTEVYSESLRTDEFGGLAGEYKLPEEAKLGQYSVFLDHEHPLRGGADFRVEEYKKPEFEVTVDAPDEPVQLGDRVTAKITAKYYYGAPVTEAKVQFKIERETHESRWYPVAEWDWLYGNGYWWFSPDYTWYRGFSRWGCIAPRPTWWHWNPDPPELVMDQEVEIGADGTVEVEIDTSLAKALHGDSDHKYRITAEVTDASRRTIVGNGEVLVSRDPYKIFAWTNRGHYSVGDTVEASFQARRLDGKGVQGSGTLQLLKVTYEDGEPVERVAQEWDLATNDDGYASQTMKATAPGQYRLSYKMQTGEETPVIEGGYLFVIRGAGFDGSDYEFNDLELIADQKSYAPGEKVKLLVNTNRVGSTVLLFVRPTNGIAAGPPQVLHLDGKSTTVELDIVQEDMPNIFVEAVTIADGDVHNRLQELFVPPEKRVLNVEVLPSSEKYLPGEKAEVEIKVTDANGEPTTGSVVLSAYDRAVEYISGGSNVGEIKEFFWKWRRNHQPSVDHNLSRWFSEQLKRGELAMANIGVFGDMVADLDESTRDRKENVAQQPGRSRMYMSRGAGGGFGGGAMPAPAMAVDSMMMEMADGAPMSKAAVGVAGGEPQMVQPSVRTNFADTAYWNAAITTDANGIGKVSFEMPENLSSWKLRAWGMGAGTKVGEGTVEVVTAKNIVVRLQAPRFFTETDEVVLSGVVHNYLDQPKQVNVELELAGETLELMAGNEFTTTVMIPAQGETRVDWRVRAVRPGEAKVTMKALTDEESDAMQMTFPVYVHGILKTDSFSGVVVRRDEKSDLIEFAIPEERKPEQTRLELRYSPTLAGAMVDALPYLVNYPYGCTEQTLNRFIPTVITQRILQGMGLDLAVIQEKRTNLNAQQIGDDRERAEQWKMYDRNPVFDEAEVTAMVEQGVKDLTAMQNSDGGWGWFSGFGEHSYPHTTAVVVHGLQLAQENDIAIVDGVVERGVAWLKDYQAKQVELLQEGLRHEDDPKRKQPYKNTCSDLDAMVFSVLVDSEIVNQEMQRFLYRDRLKVSLLSQTLIGLALHEVGAIDECDMVIRNIDQFIKVDDENQTAFLDLPNNGAWWFWYGNTIEANAHYLKLLTRVNPQDEKASGLVKYILNNRTHGGYWQSTRATAYCIEALAEYLQASGEAEPNMLVEIHLDGELKQSVEITPEVLFSYDNSFVIDGPALSAGNHKLEIVRKPLNAQPSALSPLYHNLYVTNFTMEEMITAAGLEIKVGRKYYKLVQDKEAQVSVAGGEGQSVGQKVLKYDREEIDNLGVLASGDLVEIELEIDSKNDYEYVVFEDLKAAGFEPVTLQSGYTRGGLGAYVEFRDEKVAFFLRELRRGKHSVSYRVRAEISGKFSALPTKAEAMYAPELRANSDEIKVQVVDRE